VAPFTVTFAAISAARIVGQENEKKLENATGPNNKQEKIDGCELKI